GLVGRYKQEISQAFQDAEIAGRKLRAKQAGGEYVSNVVMQSLISDEVRKVFTGVMTPMWTKAWNLGYESGKALVTGKEINFNGDNEPVVDPVSPLQNFLDTEGMHWLDQVARTGLGNSGARSEVISRTEVARAMNSGALQAYRDNGITHKHLLVSPDDVCDICIRAKAEGIIPLDAVFPNGGLSGPLHPQCRCVPGPAGIVAEPPQAMIGSKGRSTAQQSGAKRSIASPSLAMQSIAYPSKAQESAAEDPSRVGWLLIRARDESDKWRYLLQQRPDGSWGMPGGTAHVNEPGSAAAYREASEEVGDLPTLQVVADLGHIDPDGVKVALYLCETKLFEPKLNGSTPEETAGVGWFRRGEVDDLDLTPKFEDDWNGIIADAIDGLKANPKSMGSNVNGEILADYPGGQGGGARWPYPHRPSGTSGDPVEGPDGDSDETHARVYEGSDPAVYPRKRGRNKPAQRFPDQGGRRWPDTDNGGPQAPATSVGAGTVPSLTRQQRIIVAEDLGKGLDLPEILGYVKGGGKPVVGTTQPSTPEPADPHAGKPGTFDTADALVHEDPEQGVNVLPGARLKATAKPSIAQRSEPQHSQAERSIAERSRAERSAEDARLADPDQPGGPSDYSDPSPVNAEHVMNLMRSNFPENAIEWVMRSRWVGPIQIPWERIDKDAIDTWAASKQPEAVNRFAKDIKAGTGHTNPSVLIQDNDSPKAIIIDGHHRAMAHHKLGQPVLAYLGQIDPKDRQAAEETHSKQVHSGQDPRNKGESPKG
ncbi:MAG TPA: NUDIX domain-containing protein, partial [Puia sp.]|nr:NUDIX domain-containing protein [Puia sp.]